MKSRLFRKMNWLVLGTLIGIVFVGLLVYFVYIVNQPTRLPLGATGENYTETGKGWVKIFEGTYALAAQPTSDGGYIVLGTTDNGGMKDIYGLSFSYRYLFKVDSDGDMTWNKTFKSVVAKSVQQTHDDGYVIAGAVAKRNDADTYLEKTDSSGNIVWNRTFDVSGKNAGDAAYSVLQSSDRGYVIGGVTSGDNFLLKTDADGSELWEKTFELGKHELNQPRLLQQTSDSGFMIFGIMTSTNLTMYAYFIKTDSNGNMIWKKTFEEDEIGIIENNLIQQTPDRGYMVVGIGSTQINVGTPEERPSIRAYFLKMDANGNILEKKKSNADLYETASCSGTLISSVQPTSDRGYVIAREGVCLIKIDTDGNVAWKKQIVINKDDDVLEPIAYQTSNNGYIIIGNMAHGWKDVGGGYTAGELGVGDNSIIMIKTDENGDFNQPIPPKYPMKSLAPPPEKTTGKEQTQPMIDILSFFTGSPLLFILVSLIVIAVGMFFKSLKIKYWFIPLTIGIVVFGMTILSVYLSQWNPRVEESIRLSIETTGPGWSKTFGGDFNSRANSVQQTSDGGYIVTGYMGYGVKYPSGLNDTLIMEQAAVYLLKTDAKGNKVWEKSFGGLSMSACSGYDNIICTLNQDNPSGWLTETVGHSVQQTSDGGYIITGRYHTGKLHNRTSSSDYQQFEYDKGDEVYLIKTDANGNMQWNKTFDGEEYNEVGRSVQQTSDGGYFIVGTTSSYGVSPYSVKELGQLAPQDVYLIKTDANGNKVWKKTFGGTHIDMAFSGQQTSDGGYIVAGLTASLSGNGVEDVYLLKIDANGNKTWEKTFGKRGRSEAGYSVQQTSDGGYIIVGQTVWAVLGQWFNQADVYLIKTDANGNEVWEKTFGGTGMDTGYSVRETSDRGYVIAGFTASFGSIDSTTYLIKTDANGNKVWERIFEGHSGIAGTSSVMGGMTSAQQTSDGGYIITAGNMDTQNIQSGPLVGSGHDAYLIKTDENGNV